MEGKCKIIISDDTFLTTRVVNTHVDSPVREVTVAFKIITIFYRYSHHSLGGYSESHMRTKPFTRCPA